MADNVDYSAVFGTAFAQPNPMNINNGAIVSASPNHMWSMTGPLSATNVIVFSATIYNIASNSGTIRIYDNAQVQLGSIGNSVPLIVYNAPIGIIYFEYILGSVTSSIYEYITTATIYDNGVLPTVTPPTAMIDCTPTLLNSAPPALPLVTSIIDTENKTELQFQLPMLAPSTIIKHVGNRSESVFSKSVGSQLYHLKGTVSEGGTPRINVLMRMYDRTTGELMGETYSDAAGDWIFNSVFLSITKKYYVVAFDDELAPVKQAEIHDFLIPIAVT